jgi:hypothetical protein
MSRVILKSAGVDEEVNQKSGTVMRSQTFGLDLGNGYELPFKVGLGRKPAFPPGEYIIDPKSYGLDAYGNLQLKKYVDVLPVSAHRPAASKA